VFVLFWAAPYESTPTTVYLQFFDALQESRACRCRQRGRCLLRRKYGLRPKFRDDKRHTVQANVTSESQESLVDSLTVGTR